MKKLVMLLVVLALCVPTYGYILVYKVTVSGMEANWESNDEEGWLLHKASHVGYLVLDIDEDDPNGLNDVQFIDYGTDTETKHKVYGTWDADEEFTYSILPGLPPKGKKIVRMEISLMSERGTTLGGRVLGTVKSTDIGTGGKVDNVATSLKGACAWEDYEDDTLRDTGYGTLTLTLDSKWTKTANNPDEEKGFGGDFESFLDPGSDAPQGLINWLESKGYVSATPVGTQVGTAFPIANTSANEMSVGAAFDGTNFLVGIEDFTPDPANITAQFVSKTGALVGSRISLGTTGGAPHVAFDGTNYLLSWTEDASVSTFISGQLVSTSGALVGSQFTIATGTDIPGPGGYHIIFDGTNYFVAWHNESTPGQGDTRDVFGQFITPSGATLGSVIPISTAVHGQRDPAIAFDGTNILAVWTDGRNQSACYTDVNGTHCYESDVYGQFITKSGASAAGTLSGSNFLINAGTLPRDNLLSIGFDGTNYLVTFIEQTTFGGAVWEAYGIFVTKTGATIGSKFVIGNTATNHKMFPLPTYLGTKYLVTWTDGFGTTSSRIKGIYVTTSGAVDGSEFTLFSSPTGAVPWVGIVFTGGGVNLAITNWGIPNAADPFDFDLYTSADVMGAIITAP